VKPVAVIERLLENPQGFEFFQAVRLLERWWAREDGLTRRQVLATRVGFRNSLSLSFPASEIESLRAVWRELRESDVAAAGEVRLDGPARAHQPVGRKLEHVEITPAFMGFLGAGGTLPTYYTELLAQRESQRRDKRQPNDAPRAFLDIFLHRAAALFYEAWRKHRLAIQFEADRRNQFLPLMLSLAGIGHRGLRDRLKALDGGVADEALAHFAGALQRRPVSARTVQQLLSYYFRVPVKLEQFIGRWFDLPLAHQSSTSGLNMRLGRDLVIGDRVWQRDLRLRLTLGPLNGERFRRFLPGGAGELALRELLGMLTGPTLEYEVRLALRPQDVAGSTLHPSTAPRLGWDSFLCTQAETRIRAEAGYDLLALA
jgi:type VI secretion system protein ImpH